jgi:hypothetical protein
MKLDLDIAALTARGRRPAPLTAEVVRPLREADLELFATERRIEAPELKKISERHHALARALASGFSEGEAAAMVGYDRSRVSVLKASPAFRELLDLYRDSADTEFAEMHATLAGLSKDAAIELRDRLENAPQELSVGQLLQTLQLAADRTGFGPTSKQETTVKLDLSSRLEAARARVREAQALPEMKDVTPPREADS